MRFTVLTNDFDKKSRCGQASWREPKHRGKGAAAWPHPDCAGPPHPRGWGSCAGTALPWTRAHLATDPGLLQQVLLDLGALDGTPLVEVDINVLPKAAGVVVADGLGIAKRFGVGRGSWARSAPTQAPSPPLRALALPSRMGVASSTCCSIHECCPLTAARNCKISLVLSVFPAPDSPLHRTHRERQGPSRTAWASPYGASVQAASPTGTSPSPICKTG